MTQKNDTDTVKLEMTDRGAVYVNDTRITGRHTKWGNHDIIYEASCAPTSVGEVVRSRSQLHYDNITDVEYK